MLTGTLSAHKAFGSKQLSDSGLLGESAGTTCFSHHAQRRAPAEGWCRWTLAPQSIAFIRPVLIGWNLGRTEPAQLVDGMGGQSADTFQTFQLFTYLCLCS